MGKGAAAGANVGIIVMCLAIVTSSIPIPYLYLPGTFIIQQFDHIISKPLLAFNGMYILIIINVSFYIVVGTSVGYIAWLRDQSKSRFRFPYCSRCGYNLTGNESGTCTECGTEIKT